MNAFHEDALGLCSALQRGENAAQGGMGIGERCEDSRL
jgi:hypothetical protein